MRKKILLLAACLAFSICPAHGQDYLDAFLNSVNRTWQAPCGGPGATPTDQIINSIASLKMYQGGTLDLSCYQSDITLTADIFAGVTQNLRVILPLHTVTISASFTIPSNVTLVYGPGSALARGPGFVLTDHSTPTRSSTGYQQLDLGISAAPILTAGAAGTCTPQTFYYTITALPTSGGETQGSAQAHITLIAGQTSVALTWPADVNPATYRIYRGATAGNENVYYTSAVASFTDTCAAPTVGRPPTTNSAWLPIGTGGGSGTNTYPIINAANEPGTDWSGKVNTALALLPASGGIVDARGLTGAQTMSVNVPMPAKAGLLIGAATITEAAGVGLCLSAGDFVQGEGYAVTFITGNGTSPMIYQCNTAVDSAYMTLADFTVGNYVHAPPAGTPNASDMAIYLPQAANLTMHNVSAYASYGLYYGSKTAWRPDLSYLTFCNCYSHFENNLISGYAVGLTLGQNANSNDFKGNQLGGGTSVYVSTAAFSNYFRHSDLESVPVGFDVQGQDNIFDSNYFEAIGLQAGTPAWAAGYPYLAGMVIKDSNGAEQQCIVGGTSGGPTHPVWATTPQGATTADNTVTWRLVNGPTVLWESGSGNNGVTGGLSTASNAPQDFSFDFPMYVTQHNPFYAQFPLLTTGFNLSINGQVSEGGAQDLPITLSGAPTLSYHLAGGTHTTTYYYYVNLNTATLLQSTGAFGQTGLSAQATIANAPDDLGIIKTVSINAGGGGTGYPNSGTATLVCPVQNTAPTVNYTASGGILQTVTVATGGTVVAPGNCTDASPPGGGTSFSVAVDTNYVIILLPTVLYPSFGARNFQYPGGGNWDVIGRTNTTATSVLTLQGQAQFCQSAGATQGSFCDYGATPAAYTPPARNTTGDRQLGLPANGAAAVLLGLNDLSLIRNISLGLLMQPQTGNPLAMIYTAPFGAGTQSGYGACWNSDLAAAHCATMIATAAAVAFTSPTGVGFTFNNPLTAPYYNTNGLNNGGTSCTAGSSGAIAPAAATIQEECPSAVTTAQKIVKSATPPVTDSVVITGAPNNVALTFSATPTAGGINYVQGDLGALLTLVCGATVAIAEVNGGTGTGAITKIATAATGGGTACAVGAGKTTTGGTGSGATVNLTAIAAVSQKSYLPVAFTTSPTWAAGGNIAWDLAGALTGGLSLAATHNTASTLIPSHLANSVLGYTVIITQDGTGTGTTTLNLSTAGTAPTCAAWMVRTGSATDFSAVTSVVVTATANHSNALSFIFDGTNCTATF